MNRFEKSLDRLKDVTPNDNWTDEDYEHIKAVRDALEIASNVTVQEHGYWETVVEVKDNTVCGNGAKIEYKRCSRCKNPPKFWGDNFCGHCGAKLDLPQPQKGET